MSDEKVQPGVHGEQGSAAAFGVADIILIDVQDLGIESFLGVPHQIRGGLNGPRVVS